MSVDLSEALALAAASGVETEELIVGDEVDQVPHAPSHRWVLVPSSRGGVVLGGMDRGAFSFYADLTTTDGLVDALLKFTDPPAPISQATEQMHGGAAALTRQLTRERHAHMPSDPARIPIGTAFDHIGPECGHVLYPLDISAPWRSVPPTDLNEDRTVYVLQRPLPDETRIDFAPAWFGQPGGSPMFWLPRVIRYFVDDGTLVRYQTAPRPAAP